MKKTDVVNVIVVLVGFLMFLTGWPMLAWMTSPWTLAYLIVGWALGGFGSLIGLCRLGEERHQQWLKRKE